jgi:hypothetical protein
MRKSTKPLKKKNNTSRKQITACRENSKKSTGPRDSTVTRLNSITHGMVSVLIKNEQKPEFESLYASLHEDLQPYGYLENELFNDVVFGFWRLRRGRLAEVSMIRESSPMSMHSQDGEIVFEDYSIQTILKYENSARRQISKMLGLFYETQALRLNKEDVSGI